MNDDRLNDDAFAAELRRDFLPLSPSPDLARGIAASLAGTADTAPTGFAACRSWFPFSWSGIAGVTAFAAAIALFAGLVWTPGGAGQAGHKSRTVAASAPLAAAVGKSPDPASPIADTATDSTLDLPVSARPILVRDRREYVDTLRWRDRRTGARFEVSYPRSEFVLVAVEPM